MNHSLDFLSLVLFLLLWLGYDELHLGQGLLLLFYIVHNAKENVQ
jgi:uncharacterized membrane protein